MTATTAVVAIITVDVFVLDSDWECWVESDDRGRNEKAVAGDDRFVFTGSMVGDEETFCCEVDPPCKRGLVFLFFVAVAYPKFLLLLMDSDPSRRLKRSCC